MARNAAQPILTAEPGLTHYLEEIRRFPMLERQEEYLLAKRWREHGDRDAAHKLVTSHLRLVTKIARDYRGYGLPIPEEISALDEGDLHPDQVKLIAKRLGVTDQDVIDMNRRLGGDASLNAPIRDDGEAGEWQDWLVDTSPNQEVIMAEHEEFDHRREALNGAIGVLNPRERRIFEARRLAEDPMTLEDLAAEFGVSRERVRQIEVRAFEKVQAAVKGTIARQEQAALEAAH